MNYLKENKVKKKLMLATALLALGTATNVKADYWSEPYPHGGYYGYDDPNRPTGDPRVWGFRNDWEKARDFGVKPIKENEETIEVKTVPDAVLSVVYKNINGEEEVIKNQSLNYKEELLMDILIVVKR